MTKIKTTHYFAKNTTLAILTIISWQALATPTSNQQSEHAINTHTSKLQVTPEEVTTHLTSKVTPTTSETHVTDTTRTLNTALAQAKQLKLEQDPEWLKMHYFPNQNTKVSSSAVHYSDFFVSPKGRVEPTLEIQAQITQLIHDLNQAKETPLADNAFSCRFPARRQWLLNKLNINQPLKSTDCPTFTDWSQKLRPNGITIVYASNNMDGPSSMFGHSLIRIDQAEHEKNPLLNYAISYAAETNPKDNPVFYAAKGLVGLYPGSFTLLPYYDKVKEYGDLEHRDLWEYELNLSPDESKRLVNHFWELKLVRFPYFYFHSNCAYELLHLLEVARPGIELQRHFPLYSIPAETIRVALTQGKLLKQTHYRPAFSTRLTQQAHNESESITNLAKQLGEHPELNLSDLNMQQQASTLEMAYDYLYYRHLSHQTQDTARTQLNLRKLLLRRSTLNIPDQRPTIQRPSIDPTQSHHDKRLILSAGKANGENTIEMDIRPAYHDSMDPLGGYRPGASIDFLRTTTQLSKQGLKLKQFTLLDINSLPAQNAFFKPRAVNVQINWQRSHLLTTTHTISEQTRWHIQGGLGTGYGKDDAAMCYAQAQGALELSGSFTAHTRAGLGPRIGCNWYPRELGRNNFQINAKAQSLYWQNNHAWESEANIGVQYQLSQNLGLRLDGTVNYLNHTWIKQWRIGVASYF